MRTKDTLLDEPLLDMSTMSSWYENDIIVIIIIIIIIIMMHTDKQSVEN